MSASRGPRRLESKRKPDLASARTLPDPVGKNRRKTSKRYAPPAFNSGSDPLDQAQHPSCLISSMSNILSVCWPTSVWTLSLYSRALFKLLETVLDAELSRFRFRYYLFKNEIRPWRLNGLGCLTDRLRMCNFLQTVPYRPSGLVLGVKLPERSIFSSSSMDENISMSSPPVHAGPSVDDISLAPHVHDFSYRGICLPA